jgi:hypothetical protein
MNKFIIMICASVLSMASFAGTDGLSVKFDPVVSSNETAVVNCSGELLQIGVTSAESDVFNLTIKDDFTGVTIYSSTNISSTAFNLVPRISATDSDGNTATNSAGTVYVPAYVKRLSVTAGGSGTSNDVVTVKFIVKDDP